MGGWPGRLRAALTDGGSTYRWPVTLQEEHVERRGLAGGCEVVSLRPIRGSDEEAWTRLRLHDDERLAPWESTLPPGSTEQLEGFSDYVRTQARLARRGEAAPLVIEVDGDLAGQLTVAPILRGAMSQACLGYWIGSRWEGRGVVTLAVAMVTDHLLSPEGGLHRVEVNVRPENLRSIAVCRRLGLHQEGLRRGLMHIAGQWSDHLTFSAVQEDVAAEGGFVEALERRARERAG